MSTGYAHLIVTCTRRETVAAGETVSPYEHDAAGLLNVAKRHRGASSG